MSDPFDLPERDLPDHIRQAAFRRIMTEIGDVRPRHRTGLAPLLIAASVIAVVAGAMVVTSTLNTKDSKPLTASPASPHPTTSTAAGGENGYYFYGAQRSWGTGQQMDRCSSAGQQIGITWSPLLQVNRNGLTALLYRVGTDIVFCELTKETVTVKAQSYPDPPVGQQPATLLFMTQAGTYAGVTAPGVSNLVVQSGSNPLAGEPAAIGDGVFILPNSDPPTDQIKLRGFTTPDYTVPKSDVPSVLSPTTVANDPKADRTSATGQRVGTCVTKTQRPLPDTDYWQPAAFLQIDDSNWVQLATLNDALLVCVRSADQYEVNGVVWDSGAAISSGGRTKIGSYSAGTGSVFVGLVTVPNAKTVAIDPPGAPQITGTVEKGTVIVYYPVQKGPISGSSMGVMDAAGNVIDHLVMG
ncbi:hypothetical protein [Kutzneria sp. NPDC052558]|uniref:hypothetical protein n=1 Tax=Kutzneria sp. NPDC052558 TaxID=3364121 RepID=UPI0037C664DD